MRVALFLSLKRRRNFPSICVRKNVYSITYASPPKKMHKDDGFRPAFITFAPMKNKIHIVGLRYYSWCGHMDELFAPDAPAHDRWIGQKLFLQRDLHCVEDEHAVMAWTLTDPVGHVAKLDLPLIAGVLEEGGCDLVVATIVGLDAMRRALVVEPVDELPVVPCPVHEPEPWMWNGPVMSLPMMWAQSDHLGRIMDLMARGELPYDGEVVSRSTGANPKAQILAMLEE